VLRDSAEGAGVPENLDQLLEGTKSILNSAIDSKATEWALLQARIREVGGEELSLFSGMDDDEIDACLQKSVRIDCQKGDKLIKTQPEAATKLLFNMSKLLCMKVVGTSTN